VSDPLLDTIDEVLRSGIDKGVFRSECEAQDLFLSLNDMGHVLLSTRHTLSVILGRNLSTPKALKRHEDHIVAVVLGYLRRGGGTPGRFAA
jgi:Tetracyclin repressor-like, C-terminal domain